MKENIKKPTTRRNRLINDKLLKSIDDPIKKASIKTSSKKIQKVIKANDQKIKVAIKMKQKTIIKNKSLKR